MVNGRRLSLVGKADGKTFYTDDTLTSWVDWLEFCSDLAMVPGLIETPAQDLLITKYLQRFPRREYIWMDGTDLFEEGKWRSIRTDRPLNHTNWAEGQPKETFFGPFNCLSKGQLNNTDAGRIDWSTVYCFTNPTLRRVLCELP